MYQVEHEGQLKWVDAACIVVICKKEGGNVESVVWSDEIDIPADFPKGPEVWLPSPCQSLVHTTLIAGVCAGRMVRAEGSP